MERVSSDKQREVTRDFTDLVFSWSLEDIINEDLYENQVEKIPESFQSVEHYLSSFIFPLLEETRAALASSMEIICEAPSAEVITFDEAKPSGTLIYDIKVYDWANRYSDRGKEPYKTLPGDVFAISVAKPETISDLQRVGKTWTLATVTDITEGENEADCSSTHFKVKASRDIEVKDGMRDSLFVVFLMNLTTNKRIWNALHMCGNLRIIKEVTGTDSLVQEDCKLCHVDSKNQVIERFGTSLRSQLNESQTEAILASLSGIKCRHKSTTELIWGPPGTGKTKTVSVMLFILLQMKCRTLTCAPTNVAITEVASRVLQLVRESFEAQPEKDALCFSLGDILLFGNKDRLKVHSEIEEIYLDYRVQRLAECFGPVTGWRHCLTSMINFLEDCVTQYHVFIENEMMKHKEQSNQGEHEKAEFISCIEFVRDRFKSTASPLRRCVFALCTHLPRRFILEHNFQHMLTLIHLINHMEIVLFDHALVSEGLEEIFLHQNAIEDFSESFADTSSLMYTRNKCLQVLKILRCSLEDLDLPSIMNKGAVRKFCFQMASLIFCTASSSYKLHSVEMEPLNLLVIDEAAQLKECESTIPLQLPGLSHAILVGDECQLPAMVNSNVSNEAGFGRSLFERLSSLGHSKHLLNMQYRMHSSISFFPSLKFYSNRIVDAPHVFAQSYERHYLPRPMFGPYSFINVVGGREESDDGGHSRRNMVEVAVVVKILKNLFRAWNGNKKKLSIGVISPYAAQVVAIKDQLGGKYENLDGFAVKVKSIDGFQGGEEDIIIISTVRSNSGGSIGFLSSPQRTNVALTRARHCLWILGNDRTLADSRSVWEALVSDARDRQCFFSADEDKDLAKAILDVKKELDQWEDLLKEDSILFKSARWKVYFSDNFRKSFAKLTTNRTKESVMKLLLRLAGGWRPKKRNVDAVSGLHILKQFKVGGLYVVCAIDIINDINKCSNIQVLKVWDVLPLEEIPKLVKRLDSMFAMYTDDFVTLCKERSLEGDLEVPKSWETSYDLVRFKNLGNHELAEAKSGDIVDGKTYVENSKVSESLLLMKFYSLSCGVVRHLLSDRDGGDIDLPLLVTDEQLEIILFQRSTFILGRSGTGKTTVLTMKLFQKEQQHHIASEGLFAAEDDITPGVSQRNDVDECILETKGSVLRQLFVTVSPKLCHAVKQQVSGLKRVARGGDFCEDSSSIDLDDTVQFKDIPDSFLDIPPNKYPLVITFHKLLMMLDGTLGDSYFERFLGIKEFSLCGSRSTRSVALETFIRTKEVNYERFCSMYWPHFNSQITKKLDPSRVFTEIISHIKGGLKVEEACEGKLKQEDYVFLSERRVSSLSKQKRELIYKIFQDYEKMKMENGEFDLSDFVNDLHRRLRNQRFEGDEMDFLYIDEVQDLTIRQIALFKYICRNVDEGFVFAGDTAQTIARGIDFRFEDIRNLFYKEFLLEARSELSAVRKDKGQMSKVLGLKQNFRTHDGVLRLAQSVIELLYRFFRDFIDVLEPETSLIYGEAPVLLESGSDENAIVTIFGKSGNAGENIVGFGAEQVILVRDDCARKEIAGYVGKQALVLTIVECKGLEFQDVLLYNFFGSSPLQNQWRVIYEYMKEQGILDATAKSFPSFNESRHNVLCSELKQLYVAITRTRQRLWICENIEDLSKPMFDYWKKLCLVQERRLDDSLAQAMQVASSPQEWKARGIKLFHENNYEMATMCFERAGDIMWEKRAKASGLKAAADRMRGSNSEAAWSTALRQAAEIFDSIGRADSAAECFCDLKEYERAGRIYLKKCGKTELNKAGECFRLAGCYKLAAEVYATGNHFSECLFVCSEGKLFDMGLQYIQYWKQHAPRENVMSERSKEIDIIEQEFLQRCARNHYDLGDNRSMMKFVRAFNSVDSRRKFLKSLNCLNELLLMEEESGNFLEAAEIANMRGDLLLEADLLGKAGHFTEASKLILWYAFCSSLWASRSRGWPLKNFPQKDDVFARAKSFAMKESDLFKEFVCTEVNILAHEETDLSLLNQFLTASYVNKSLRGEILSIRKILDFHLRLGASKFDWEDGVAVDLMKYSKERVSHNRVSVQTLICFWNLWTEKIQNVFEYLLSLETQVVSNSGYGDFCLNYFGVRRQMNNINISYLLLNSDADWVREIDDKYLRRSGNLVSADARQFVYVAKRHWRSELLSVGLKVLETLEAIHKLSIKNSKSVFCQSMPLVYVFEVAKFLLGSKYLDCKYHDTQKLHSFLKQSYVYSKNVFPLDWRTSLTANMSYLRGSKLSQDLLEEVILENICSKSEVTYGEIGRILVIWLGSGKPTGEVCKKIVERFGENLSWREFIEDLSGSTKLEVSQEPVSGNVVASIKVSLSYKFHNALKDTFNANWRGCDDYIAPNCFLYLVERLLILASCYKGFFFTTKSSFVEWIIYGQSDANRCANLVTEKQFSVSDIFDFMAYMIKQFLYNKQDTAEWIKNSKINFNYYYPLLLLRLVVTLCLLCVNSGKYFEILVGLLGRNDITSQLPWEFCDVLRRSRKQFNAKVMAEAFMKIGNPLVIVTLGENCSNFLCTHSIFVDMRAAQSREDIISELFPIFNKAPQGQTLAVPVNTSNSPAKEHPLNNDNQAKTCKATSSNEDQKMNNKNIEEGNLQIDFGLFHEISENLKWADYVGVPYVLNFPPSIKAQIDNWISFLSAVLTEFLEKNACNGEEVLFVEANSTLDELKQLFASLDMSEQEQEKNRSMVTELLRALHLRRPRLEILLNHMCMQKDANADGEANEKEAHPSKVEETSYSDKGIALEATVASTPNSGDSQVAESKGKRTGKSKKYKKGKGGKKAK